jgi:hypothetical protein
LSIKFSRRSRKFRETLHISWKIDLKPTHNRFTPHAIGNADEREQKREERRSDSERSAVGRAKLIQHARGLKRSKQDKKEIQSLTAENYNKMSSDKRHPITRLKIGNVMVREFLSELIGTFVLIAFGDGVVAQVVLSDGLGDPKGSFFTINWGWGVGVTMGALVAGGASGAHLNPAVTLALAIVGEEEEFVVYSEWKKGVVSKI